MRCTRNATNTGPKKVAKNRHLGTISQFRRAVFAGKARIHNWKNLLGSNTSSTCPYNMVNFGPLAAEILSLVWLTPTTRRRAVTLPRRKTR